MRCSNLHFQIFGGDILLGSKTFDFKEYCSSKFNSNELEFVLGIGIGIEIKVLGGILIGIEISSDRDVSVKLRACILYYNIENN